MHKSVRLFSLYLKILLSELALAFWNVIYSMSSKLSKRKD